MTKTLEEYFLKIFKVVVLAVMSALLIATIVLLIIAFYNLTTQPIMPSPVKEPKIRN